MNDTAMTKSMLEATYIGKPLTDDSMAVINMCHGAHPRSCHCPHCDHRRSMRLISDLRASVGAIARPELPGWQIYDRAMELVEDIDARSAARNALYRAERSNRRATDCAWLVSAVCGLAFWGAAYYYFRH